MKFNGLEIAKTYERTAQDTYEYVFKGKISFETEQSDTIYLSITKEDTVKFIEAALPIFERVLNEKLTYIKKEVGLNDEG